MNNQAFVYLKLLFIAAVNLLSLLSRLKIKSLFFSTFPLVTGFYSLTGVNSFFPKKTDSLNLAIGLYHSIAFYRILFRGTFFMCENILLLSRTSRNVNDGQRKTVLEHFRTF